MGKWTDAQRLPLGRAVAWSRTGTIASISPDGQVLELRFLRCSPENGTWDLSEPTTCQLVKGTPSNPLVHLEWSSTSSPDLAVIDAVGRVAIIPFSQYLNQPFQSRKWDSDPIDDMHTIVGCHWLWVALVNPQVRTPSPMPDKNSSDNIKRSHTTSYMARLPEKAICFDTIAPL
jgi:hypothetical protein